MIGMTLTIPGTDITGTVDAVSVQADGTALVRVCDRWFSLDR